MPVHSAEGDDVEFVGREIGLNGLKIWTDDEKFKNLNLILQSNTGCVKESKTESKSVWQPTPVPNLVRYIPSGILFARVRVKGKLIRRSLKTKTFTVGKLRLGDFEKKNGIMLNISLRSLVAK